MLKKITVASILYASLVGFQIKGNDINKRWFEAARTGNVKIIEKLIGKININAQDTDGHTALIYASSEGHDNTVKRLLEVPGINVNIKNNNGYTALIYASLKGHEDIVKILLQVPAIDVNAQNKHGATALMRAAFWGHGETVKLLLNVGADPNIKDNNGKTVLEIDPLEAEFKPTLVRLINKTTTKTEQPRLFAGLSIELYSLSKA